MLCLNPFALVVSSTQHLALDTFQEKLLPKWSSTISHPFSTLALEYVLSTVFTHLHLYQFVLNDAGTVETLHVDLTVPAPPVCEPLQQGACKRYLPHCRMYVVEGNGPLCVEL